MTIRKYFIITSSIMSVIVAIENVILWYLISKYNYTEDLASSSVDLIDISQFESYMKVVCIISITLVSLIFLIYKVGKVTGKLYEDQELNYRKKNAGSFMMTNGFHIFVSVINYISIDKIEVSPITYYNFEMMELIRNTKLLFIGAFIFVAGAIILYYQYPRSDGHRSWSPSR